MNFEYNYDPTKTIMMINDTIIFFPQVESIKLNKNNILIHYISGRTEVIEVDPKEVKEMFFK